MLLFLLPLLLLSAAATVAQPSPGYSLSSKLAAAGFYADYDNRWGPQRQSVSADGSSVTLWLDKSSGSGFKSKRAYSGGYFGVSMKLQGGYTAGVISSFYLSNNEAHPGFHDEVDIEFLGTIPGKPYTLQTNVYVRGSGDSNVIGREMRFHLWFDPTAGFHHYAVLWDADQILFFVDDIPIRQYRRTSDATFPQRPMWVYGSIWDASSWATEGGLYKADYRYQPFVAHYTSFKTSGCSADAAAGCHLTGTALTTKQASAMKWAQSNYMIYNYCTDSNKDRSRTPECSI